MTSFIGRKPATRRPFEQAAEWRALLNAAVDAIVVIDAQGTIETFNPAAERVFGYESSEIIGQSVNKLMPEPFRGEHDAYITRYVETGKARIIGIGREAVGQRSDGTTFPIDLSVGEVRSVGSPRFVGIVRDISDRVETQQALQRERDRAQRYLDVAEVMFVVLDNQGRVRLVNRKGHDILGYPDGELIGQDWFETCVPERNRKRVKQIFKSLMSGEVLSPEFFENPVLTRDGAERLVEWRNVVLTDQDGSPAGTLSSGTDITDRRRTEEEARQTRERMSHMARLTVLGEMAASLAHEINQPLTAIVNYTQACQRMLESGRGQTDEVPGILAKVAQQAERAGQVIQRLRGFVRQRQPGKELVDCNAVIRGLASLAELDARDNQIELDLELAEDLPLIAVDTVLIQQVLLNLIRNGIDSMIESGANNNRIIVRSARAGGKFIEITVTDHGGGLTEEARERMFEPFFTTKSNGMGLGLAICHSIVEAHGGKLDFKENADSGLVFRFTLPAVAGE